MATVIGVLADDEDAGDEDAAEADDEAGAELAELAELLDELLTEQPASASAATAASSRVRRGHRPANVTILDIWSSFGPY
jgi:hypothetical protein